MPFHFDRTDTLEDQPTVAVGDAVTEDGGE